MNDNDKNFYQLGYRDAIAGILAKTKDKIKLPEIAEYYKESFKEEHFSHKYHTT